MKTFSIITVSFNAVKTIGETIRSVLGQDYPNIEYIIIDGGSRDGTLQIIEGYRDKIHTVKSEPDEGIYDAMNKGIQLASGDIIGILNADDLYAHSGVISSVAKAFCDPSVQACYGDLLYFSDTKERATVRYWRAGGFTPGLFSRGWNPPHPTFFVQREVYERFGGFDTSYSMGNDVELMMRFLEKHRIQSRYIPELFVKMRLGGVSNRAFKNIILQNKNIIQAAKNQNIKISTWTFVLGKIFNRLSQFIIKSRSTYRHVN